ncbi:MAG: 30S ribosomal protein THX [Planctomycetota bacterium]|nr:MAG: 30S ribosomal protein THX [Planctomycetota bacterium]
MGKGDKRTKRGKIFAGSYGKCRANPKKIRRARKAKLLAAKKNPPSTKETPSQ